MIRLKFSFLILFISLFPFVNSQAQRRDITPLHKFMQLHADTTFMLELPSGWVEPPHYRLFSKKGDTVTAYIYEVFYKKGIPMPRSIRNKLSKVNGYNPRDTVDVNKFFRPVPMRSRYQGKLWPILMEEQPWSILDDKIEGTGCPKSGKTDHLIYDGGTINLYLITAKEIKLLSFYAPDFYEQHCPGRKGRKFILKIKDIFDDFFRDDF